MKQQLTNYYLIEYLTSVKYSDETIDDRLLFN